LPDNASSIFSDAHLLLQSTRLSRQGYLKAALTRVCSRWICVPSALWKRLSSDHGAGKGELPPNKMSSLCLQKLLDQKTYLIRRLLRRSLVKTRNTLEVAAATRRHVKQARKSPRRPRVIQALRSDAPQRDLLCAISPWKLQLLLSTIDCKT
jgi:hypothetical protein